jgi:hypothetical protein
MTDNSPQSISEVTRRAIFKAMRRQGFRWWGDSDEADLLGQVFDLESMESQDSRLPDAAEDIRIHRDHYSDWPDDWIFGDERLDLLHCPDATLLKLFETMVHPTVQSELGQAKWLVDLVNRHLAGDGWRLEKVSSISGRPVYQARRREPKELSDSPRYVAPDDLDIDLESFVYSVSRVFAHRGKTTEVAILAEAAAELTQVGYDNWDGGTYGYALYLRIPPGLYAQIADERSEYATVVRDEMSPHFPAKRNLQEVLIQPFQKAPEGWQDKAKAWVGGKGVTNQGRVRSTNIAGREHDGLLFRSQPEINLYEALKKRGVAFAPLPVFLRGGENYQRLEPDFIVIKDGIFAIVEVDGDNFHTESPAAARTRLKLLEDAGAYIVRVNASACGTMEFAEACAEGILNDIATHKNNRR